MDVTKHPHLHWLVDLHSGMAVLGLAAVKFEIGDDDQVSLSFIDANELSLEEQCKVAGRAMDAIKKAYREDQRSILH